MRVVTLTDEDLSDLIQDAYLKGAKAVRSLTLPKPPPTDGDELLTAQQAADLLGVSSRTIKRRAASGELRKLSHGNVVRYRRADVLALLK